MTPCPFRLCSATVDIVVEQATPGDDETTLLRLPIHDISGNGAYGRCPASLLALPLTPALYDMLEEAAKFIEVAREAADAAARADWPRDEPVAKPPKPTATPYWFNGGLGGPYAGKGIGATNDAIKLDFTPTPEPSPAPTPPPTGVPMSDDSMRARLRELTLLACKALGEAQDLCSQITTTAEVLDGLMEQLKAKQSTAATLARLAVGSDAAPDNAKAMVDGAVVAIGKVDEADASVQALLVRVASVAASDASAATSGISYLGTL